MALWTPAEITTRLWFDFSDATTITLNGSDVSQADDKSGNDDHLTQGDTSKQPLLQSAAQNSLDVIEFDGVDETLAIGSSTTLFKFLHYSQSSVYIVLKAGTSSDPDDFYNILATRNSGADRGYAIAFDDRTASGRQDQIIAVARDSGVVFSNLSAANAFSANAHHVFASLSDPANGTAADRSSMFVDGGTAIENNASTGTGTDTASAGNFTIGAGSGDANPLLGQIGEIVVLDSLDDTTAQQIMEGYLAHKWGLEANLPGGHPYKSAAPTVAGGIVQLLEGGMLRGGLQTMSGGM